MTLEDRADSAAPRRPRRPLTDMFEAYVGAVFPVLKLDRNKKYLNTLLQGLLAEPEAQAALRTFSHSGFVASYMGLGKTNAAVLRETVAVLRETVAALAAVVYGVPSLPGYRTQSYERRN